MATYGHEGGGWMNADQRSASEYMTPATESGPRQEPQTHEEARQFHQGFLAGATAYAAAVGHTTLKRDNEKLREVFDAQGWRTIEQFEKLAARNSSPKGTQ